MIAPTSCGVEDELGHVRMSDEQTLCQSLSKSFNWIPARERSKRRSFRMRAKSGGAGGMTASAILGQQGFAALQGRAPLLCRQRGHGTHRDSGEEKPEQELDVHAS